MKLSEKIQEALREQQEINLSDPAVQKRLAAQWGGMCPLTHSPRQVSRTPTRARWKMLRYGKSVRLRRKT